MMMKQWSIWPMYVAAAMICVACRTGGDSVTDPKNRSSVIPWDVELNHHAIVATVNEEVQLNLVGYMVNGDVFDDMPQVEYETSDISVTITPDGIVKGTAARDQVLIYATVRGETGGMYWRHADTAAIAIVDTAYTFAEYKMQLNIPSGIIPANRRAEFPVQIFDANGDSIPSVPSPIAYYESTAPSDIFYHGNGRSSVGNVRNVGETKITATSYIFGQEYRDSLTLEGTYPDSAMLYIHRQSALLNPSPSVMGQSEITVLRNGKVTFRNNNPTAPSDIVFDNQAGVIGGNIPNVLSSPGNVVQFPNLGKFTFKSTQWGFTGTVTVVDP